MDIHEYQAKEILAQFGVAVPRGAVADTADRAMSIATALAGEHWAVKAQIHAGGRGKAGGVRLCHSCQEVAVAAEALLGKPLVTAQTGPQGQVVKQVYVECVAPIGRELYLAVVLDRRLERIRVLASRSGGVDIEESSGPGANGLLEVLVDPALGLRPFQARELAFGLGLNSEQTNQAVASILGCYRAFRDLDAQMIEINPLVVTSEGQLLALDAKMSFDDNALFRRPSIAALREASDQNPRESRAAQIGMNYVGLTGSIGCVINGAGLALATLDMIKLSGGDPANFLDVGGGASPERIEAAFDLVLDDPNVRVVLVNIFAGINRCDWVAEGIVRAAAKMRLPLVVRLAGTHADSGERILRASNLDIITAHSLGEAAERAVAAARIPACSA